MIKTISNDDLKLDDVPHENADWSNIARFALTFNGYKHHGSFDKCAEIANNHHADTWTELRTCLFFEQRRWPHFGETPDEDTVQYIRELVQNIRQKIADGDGS